MAVAGVLLASAPAGADIADNDPQLWVTTKLAASINPKVMLLAEMELRVGNGMAELYRQHTDLGLRFEVVKLPKLRASVDVVYRQAFWHGYFFNLPSSASDVDQAWMAEYRPGAAFTLTVPLGRFTLADTVRLDVRLFENGMSEQIRLQETLVAALDVGVKSGYSFRFFASVGICAVLHPDADYDRTRIYVGLMFPIVGPLALNVYYMWQRFRVEPGWFSWHAGFTVYSRTYWDWHVMGMSLSVFLGMPQDPAGGST